MQNTLSVAVDTSVITASAASLSTASVAGKSILCPLVFPVEVLSKTSIEPLILSLFLVEHFGHIILSGSKD